MDLLGSIESIGWITLTILPFILVGIRAVPPKKTIDLDVSGPRPTKVKSIPSERFPGGTNYVTGDGSRHTHVIGMVRDVEEVIIEGDPTAASRYVFVLPREDGMMYIRVMTRWRIRGNSYRTYVREFLKLTDSPYRELNRDPTDVDILTQEDDQFISVTKSVGGSREGQEGTITYTIKPEFWVTNTIGVVMYGHYILEDRLEGLMERTVTWYGGLDAPIITITSKYNNGTEVVSKHMLVDGELNTVDYRSRPFLLCG